MVKNLPANAEDVGLIPGSGRSPGEGNGNPLQYSCLGNLTGRGAWQDIVFGIFQTRILEWVTISFSRGSSRPGIEPMSPALQVDSLPSEPTGKLNVDLTF